MPLLGMTWMFGLLMINDDTIAFAWIFTILNSLQVAIVNHCSNIIDIIIGLFHLLVLCGEE